MAKPRKNTQYTCSKKLAKPVPELLDKVLRDLLRPDRCIHRSLPSIYISINSSDEMSSLQQSPEEIETEIDGDADIVGDEGLIIKRGGEGVESIEQNDHAEED